MNSATIVAILIVIFGAAIVAVKIIQNKKKYSSLQEFIDEHGDAIIKILKDAIIALKYKMEEFPTQEDYEKALIELAVKYFKDFAEQLGFPKEIIDAIPNEKLAELIYQFFQTNKIDAFTVLDSVEIAKNQNIIDDEVVEVLGAHEEPIAEMAEENSTPTEDAATETPAEE